MKDIGINLFDAYYNQEKKYQTGLKPGKGGDKVVGTKLRKIMLHLHLLHHAGEKNLLILHHHHNHVTEYPTPPPPEDNQQTTTLIETIFPIISE